MFVWQDPEMVDDECEDTQGVREPRPPNLQCVFILARAPSPPVSGPSVDAIVHNSPFVPVRRSIRAWAKVSGTLRTRGSHAMHFHPSFAALPRFWTQLRRRR